MKNDFFDYDELSRSVNDLLDDELGTPVSRADSFEPVWQEDDLPDNAYIFRNAANSYGADYPPEEPTLDYDEEAAAMRYDPQTNTGAVIRAYNTDYASRAVQRSRKKGKVTAPPAREEPERPTPTRSRMRQEPPRTARPTPRDYDRSGMGSFYDEGGHRVEKPRKRKKHTFLKLLLTLLLLLAVAVAVLWIFARQPDGESLAGHRDGATAILLAGTDEDGTRTDTMMLLYLDEKEGEMGLLSLPRDTYTSMDISVPKLNAVYGVAGGGKDGMERLLDYTEECIGYRPDGYVLIDLDCFESLVNLMGGVTFDVPMDMSYEDPSQDLYIDLKAGEQKLSGKEAMWVVRYRSGYAAADLQRVEVQRDFIQAALEQWLTVGNLWKTPGAAALLTANTTTNLSLQELAWIAKAAKSIGTENVQTDTLPGEAANVGDGSYYILWPETTARLINEHYNPYHEEVSTDAIYSPYY